MCLLFDQFLAVYDYRPAEHSPNDDPSSELSFKAGDIVVTYGNVRPDGFYQAKVLLMLT